MGADGHIRIYDAEIVDRIIDEINATAGDNAVGFPGYRAPWTCNGRPCYLTYWDSEHHEDQLEYAADDSFIYSDSPERAALRERYVVLRDRCNAEAVIVDDQEVWT